MCIRDRACDAVQQTALSGMNLSDGIVRVTVILKPEVFYQVLSEQTGPVSYTHLDVYKRQELYLAMNDHINKGEIEKARAIQYDADRIIYKMCEAQMCIRDRPLLHPAVSSPRVGNRLQ